MRNEEGKGRKEIKQKEKCKVERKGRERFVQPTMTLSCIRTLCLQWQ